MPGHIYMDNSSQFTAEAQRAQRTRRDGKREKTEEERLALHPILSSSLCEFSAFSAPLR
jgi:hypothetical protein